MFVRRHPARARLPIHRSYSVIAATEYVALTRAFMSWSCVVFLPVPLQRWQLGVSGHLHCHSWRIMIVSYLFNPNLLQEDGNGVVLGRFPASFAHRFIAPPPHTLDDWLEPRTLLHTIFLLSLCLLRAHTSSFHFRFVSFPFVGAVKWSAVDSG